MTQPVTIEQTDAATAATVPHSAALQEINIYSHSTLLYWWPAWAIGFLFALLNAGQEKFLATAEGAKPSSALGLTYVSILLLLIVFTNVRLRGINSVVVLARSCIHRRPAGLVRLVGRHSSARPLPFGAHEHRLLSRVFIGSARYFG